MPLISNQSNVPLVYIDQKICQQCLYLVYALVITLVFEGLLRKAFAPLSIIIFFVKDFICLFGLYLLMNNALPDIIGKLKFVWLVLFIFIVPLLYFTGFKDPILIIFASKQYLLYIVSALYVLLAFPIHEDEKFRKFLLFTSLLLIPTALIAVTQNALPPTHWLNLSVGGESLEAFSSAGYLRVSSTFSFTGQYSWFLNVETFLLVSSFFLPPSKFWGINKNFYPFIYAGLAFLLILSAFVTGGRTAVLGCGAVLSLGMFFVGFKIPSWVFSKGLLVIIFCVIGLSILREVKPEFFAAYDQRSLGYGGISGDEEISNRVLGGFTDWNTWFWEQSLISILFGNGLGIMSNGASQVSSYAHGIRANGYWTEGDVPSTLWEGGVYLAFVWYGFRIYLVFNCFKIWNRIQNVRFSSGGAFVLAFIIIHGLTSPLGIQSPLYIWWCLSIGILYYLYRSDNYLRYLTILNK